MAPKSLIFFIVWSIHHTQSARILGIMPTPSYSHHVVFTPLWLKLNSLGHHVTLLTTNPIKNANLTDFRQVDWSFAHELWHEKHNFTEMAKNYKRNIVKSMYQYSDMIADITTQELQHSEVQRLLGNEEENFDLVIVEILNPAMMAFSSRFKCPFIGISPMDVTNFVHEALGNPVSPALYPDFLTPFDGGDMSFFERILNTLYYLGTKLYFRYYFFPKNDNIVKGIFGVDTPSLEQIQKNVSMVFLNVNPIVHNIRPLMGNVLSIGGGGNVDTNATLPSDIQKFLDEAAAGAIYFSLGTNINSSLLSNRTRNAFLKAFSEVPYRVLWKSGDHSIPSNRNILVKNWVPQLQILNHQNLKLFITHGGLQSLEEAICSAVPIIAVPMFVDQFSNVKRVIKKGLGIALDYETVDTETLKQTINEVITNKKFESTARELQHLLKELPSSGISEAIRWIEYVIKHRGAKFLKPPEIPLYQYLLLDVTALFLLVCAIQLFVLYRCLKFFIFCVREGRRDEISKLKQC